MLEEACIDHVLIFVNTDSIIDWKIGGGEKLFAEAPPPP